MTSRPVLKLPFSPGELVLEFAAGAGLAWLVGLALLSYDSLPASIPTHFGLGGEPDGWGPRWTILILPAVGLLLYVVLTVMARFPHRLNYLWEVTEANASGQYRLARTFLGALKVEIVWFFGYIKFTTIQIVMGDAPGLVPVFLPLFLGTTLRNHRGLHHPRPARSLGIDRLRSAPTIFEEAPMQVFLLLALLVAALAVIFAIQNTEIVTVDFLVWSFQGSLALILLIALAAGAIASSLASIPAMFRTHRLGGAQRRIVEDLQAEVVKLKATA